MQVSKADMHAIVDMIFAGKTDLTIYDIQRRCADMAGSGGELVTYFNIPNNTNGVWCFEFEGTDYRSANVKIVVKSTSDENDKPNKYTLPKSWFAPLPTDTSSFTFSMGDLKEYVYNAPAIHREIERSKHML